MKHVLWFVITILSFLSTQAQSGKKEDVVYLKNEWIIRGRIIEKTAEAVKIQTANGNVFSFRQDEVLKITNENSWTNLEYKTRGFASFTELGPLIAGKTSSEGVTTAAFSFQTINGFRFSQYAFLGLGVGADLYAIQTIIPVFLSFRGDFSRSGAVIPYYFGNFGYGINITQSSPVINDFKGGLQYAVGIGIKVPFNRTAGFLFSAGYSYQATSYVQGGLNRDVNYQRLAIRAGFFL